MRSEKPILTPPHTCEGCFVRQYICSESHFPITLLFSLHSGMSRAVIHRSFRRWMSTIDTFQCGPPIPLFTFCSKLIKIICEADGMCGPTVTYLLRRSSGWMAWVTASASIVKHQLIFGLLLAWHFYMIHWKYVTVPQQRRHPTPHPLHANRASS